MKVLFEDRKSVSSKELMGRKRYDAFINISMCDVLDDYVLSVRDFNGNRSEFMLDNKESLESMIRVLEKIKDKL